MKEKRHHKGESIMNERRSGDADQSSGKDTEESSVAELIQRRLDLLTPSERKPASVLLGNYPMVGLENLATFAQRAGVSHPTILRFIAKLGYAGYADFQAALRAELEARLKSPLAKRLPDNAEPVDDDFLAHFAETVRDNIRQSVDALPRAEFENALELLEDMNNTLYLLGGRITDPVAVYAYVHLRMLRSRVRHISGPPVSWSEHILDMDRRTVLIVFDIRRYQEDLAHFTRQALERGARVILVTDNWLSPIASLAEQILAVRIKVPSNWDSVAAMITLVEALIAAMSNRNWNKLEKRIRTLEQMRAEVQGDGMDEQ